MFRHSPGSGTGRNQRSKGNKIKYGLQVCFLAAVCFWLMYQVKHSYDKKKELDESDVQSGLTTKITTDATQLGRKDLKPKTEETVMTKKEVNEEQEEETAEVEEKNNNEEREAVMEDGKDEEENIIKENIKINSKDSSDPLENENKSADQTDSSSDSHFNTTANDAVNNIAMDGATFGDVSGSDETTSETGDSRDNNGDINDKTTVMEDNSGEFEQNPKEFSDSITGLAGKDIQTGLEKLAEILTKRDDEDIASE